MSTIRCLSGGSPGPAATRLINPHDRPSPTPIVTRITPTGLARRGTRLILSLEPTSTSAESPGNPLQPDSHSERRQQSSINLTPDSTWSRLTYCALRNTDQQNSISGPQNACKSVGIKLPHTLLIYSNNPRSKKWLKRALPDPMLKCRTYSRML